MGVGKNIKALREKFDLTQDQLADSLGVTRESIVRWESDKMAVRDRHIARMVELYGLDPDDIRSESAGIYAQLRGTAPLSNLAASARRAIAGPTVLVPVRGRVHAGSAGDPDVFDDGYGAAEILQSYFEADPEVYVLDFEGDCMSKDFGETTTSLIVSPNSPFGNGSIVVAVVDDTDYVVRRLEQNAKELRLKPNSWNPAYEDIVIPRDSDRQVSFKGKVLGCFKRFD